MRAIRPGLLVLVLLVGSVSCSRVNGAPGLPLHQIHLPPRFEISIYASPVPNARSMALSPHGTLFVGTLTAGNVYAVIDRNQDGKADEVITIAQGLNMPNGVAFRDGALYVAEVNRILRYDDIETHLKDPPAPVVVYDGLPRDRHHGWKFIAFGPDGWLYIPVGAPCNVCERDDARYASITRMKPNGPDWKSLRKASVIRSASIGIRRRMNCGLRTTGAIGWVAIRRRTS